MSNNGLWVVGTSSTGVDDGGGGSTVRQAVLWTPDDDIVGLGWIQDTGSRYSFARDVTNDGSMVVGRAGGGGLGDLAFLWTPDDGMRDLNEVLLTDYGLDVEAMGWELNHANAISPDGSVIAGLGINPRRARRGVDGATAGPGAFPRSLCSCAAAHSPCAAGARPPARVSPESLPL